MRARLAIIVFVSGCGSELRPRPCSDDATCLKNGIMGYCLYSPLSDDRWCAFDDSTCNSGQRWGIRAGDGLKEMCVTDVGGPDAAVSDGSPDAPATCPGCPETPSPRFPWNGYTTGSVWATATTLANKPLQPKFIWEPVTAADDYEIQVDDSCETPGFLACAFESPELDLQVSATEIITPTALPVSRVPPVGARYYWRVRACNGTGCSPWSPVRYLDVGRQRSDLDGDGYSDLVVGASAAGAGRVYVFRGGPSASFDSTPDGDIIGSTQDHLGRSLATLGDVNADGFADFVVGAYGAGADDAGRAFVYFGGDGFDLMPDGTLAGEAPSDLFGWSVTGAGDFDGDGYSDVVVGAPNRDAYSGGAYLFLGESGSAFDPNADIVVIGGENEFVGNAAMTGGADLNGDGFTDLVVGAAGALGGAAFVLYGSSVPDTSIEGTLVAPPGAGLTGPLSVGDVDQDGYADVLVLSGVDSTSTTDDAAYVYRGGPGGSFDVAADASLAQTQQYLTFNGDLNGDGRGDFSTGDYKASSNRGLGWVYFGTEFPLNLTPDGVLTGSVAGDELASVGAAGDVNGDGFDDLAIGAYKNDAGGADAGRVYLYFGSVGTSLEMTVDGTLTGMSGEMFGIEIN
jgi:hypothetical protein